MLKKLECQPDISEKHKLRYKKQTHLPEGWAFTYNGNAQKAWFS
jgi:hypothetical protein